MKVALLSNVNMDPVNRILINTPGNEVYASQGYGNELGILLNKESPVYAFGPETVFLIIDIMETIQHNICLASAEVKINEWFSLFENTIEENIVYYISDAYLYGFEMDVVWDKGLKRKIETIWSDYLQRTVEQHSNVRVFPYSKTIQRLGEENAFSSKMWHMGKILHSSASHKALSEEINHYIALERRTPKKVLLLDLDNTLWRGLAGEHDITPIVLSEDGAGLAYKNFQRSILQLKLQGVILGIVSKNNEEDALQIINNHPHMILHQEDFAVTRINWENKAKNIVSVSQELNVGLDSIVFIDDNPAERALVSESLPEVITPDFPDRPEELTSFIAQVYHRYFEKPVVTEEDKEKTSQYQANSERKKLMETSMDFEGYLNNLQMKLYRVNPGKNKERFVQLVNKTNQFNLTTRRITGQEASNLLGDKNTEVFLYRVVDRFGDSGIVAAGILEFHEEAVVTEFVMSCRVMGRKIEEAIIVDFENEARRRGYKELVGIYKPTEKNRPVKDLYVSFGYKPRKGSDDESAQYTVCLNDDLSRNIYVEKIEED